MILLDSHVLVWLVEDDPKLGVKARDHILRDASLYVSTISGWELAMLSAKGKLGFSKPLLEWFEEAVQQTGSKVVEIGAATGVDAGTLPGNIHGDPADRMIIATARVLGCPVLTADHKILAYAKAGHVQAIDARR